MNDFVLPLLGEEKHLPFFVYGVGCKMNQERVLRVNGYNHFIWLHTVQGKGKLKLENNEYILLKGNGILIYPQVPHEFVPLEEQWETHWVSFRGFAVQPLLEISGFPRSGFHQIPNLIPLDNMLKDIYSSAKSNNPEKGFTISIKLYHFLIELKKHVFQEGSNLHMSYAQRLHPVLVYIEEHFNLDLSLEQLAGIFGTSQQYFCRIFRKAFKMSPSTYMTRLRIQKAKELLIGQELLTVAEIAGKTGFRNTSYFCFVFKQQEGLSPLEFKHDYH